MVWDLDEVNVFVAVADAEGFRAAGEKLGVSGSAVSHALRRLELRAWAAPSAGYTARLEPR